MKTRFATAMILAAMGLARAAAAQDAGEWVVRSGFHSIAPKSGNHALVEVEDEIGLTFNVTYMFAPNWGVELLAALPFLHEITLNGAGAVAETDLLPPTLSAQYHFNPNGRVRPYVGAGLNYTTSCPARSSTSMLAGSTSTPTPNSTLPITAWSKSIHSRSDCPSVTGSDPISSWRQR